MIDSAMIQLIGFWASEDRGRMLENTAFLHLKMLGHEIYFHKEQRECDFLIREKNTIVQAIQVTTNLADKKVRKREIEGLLEAMKSHSLQEGLILTENDEEIVKIEILPVWKWLLS